MRQRQRENGWVDRLCLGLGRQTFASGFLDWVASCFLTEARPAVALPLPSWRAPADPDGSIMLMADGPGTTWTHHGTAPTSPAESNQDHVTAPDRPGLGSEIWHALTDWLTGGSHQQKKEQADRMAGNHGCEDARYHGMHGRPCRFAGGSDLKCPTGTTSGWFWSYDTPAGRIFYVDCCGGTPHGAVWCNWTQENNWCVGWGKAANAGITAYNCTLAIPDSQMKTRDIGGGKLEVVGVDP